MDLAHLTSIDPRLNTWQEGDGGYRPTRSPVSNIVLSVWASNKVCKRLRTPAGYLFAPGTPAGYTSGFILRVVLILRVPILRVPHCGLIFDLWRFYTASPLHRRSRFLLNSDFRIIQQQTSHPESIWWLLILPLALSYIMQIAAMMDWIRDLNLHTEAYTNARDKALPFSANNDHSVWYS
jgi:hypothetical protein